MVTFYIIYVVYWAGIVVVVVEYLIYHSLLSYNYDIYLPAVWDGSTANKMIKSTVFDGILKTGFTIFVEDKLEIYIWAGIYNYRIYRL